MRTSHRMIRKMILDRKSKITDEEFFSSKAYKAYLTDLVETATRRYQKPISVVSYYDPDDSTIAYTDFGSVNINVANRLTSGFPSRKLKSLSIVGLASHECGHILFTDNRIWDSCFRRLMAGRFYPSEPKGSEPMHALYAKEILRTMKDDSDPIPKTVILNTYHALSNILEDGFVDARYSYEFPGIPAQGIALNNRRFAETMKDLQEMVNAKFYDHSIILNLLIQYARAGEINNLSGYQGELVDKIQQYIPLVDAAIYDDDARTRCETANEILVDLWPIMQRCFDPLRQKQQEAAQQAQQQMQQSGSGSSGDSEEESQNVEAETNAAGSQAVETSLESQLPQAAPNFVDRSGTAPSSGSFLPNQEQMEQLRNTAQKVVAEETARIAQHETQSIEDGDTGGMERDTGYEGSGYDSAAEDIERMLEQVAENQVDERLEEELSQQLQLEANAVQYGNVHKEISVTVNRMTYVDSYLVDAYHSVAPQLLQLSKRLQKGVGTVLRDKRQGGKQTGLLAGKRLNQHAFGRTDGRIFCNSRLPTEPIRMSVALLVDESGSMCGSDRITRARAAAIVMQDFCEKLGIPIMIVGHTASSRHVDLYSYADFNSVDRQDRYRLMDMSARCCNRDGAALRYVAEKLAKQNAEIKLLMIISDGQPNDDGYSGSAAEADLRGIKVEFSRKGVDLYAAAIGDDKENIERIYGSGFLDITDLNQLPILLTNIIARNIK